jgi:3-hydroxyisobutyrate dehydrogenase
MGRPMATHLVHAGHTVRGVELHPVAAEAAREAGIEIVDSVAQAVADADVVFTMLPSAQHVQDVLTGPNGVFSAARPGTLFVDSSTIDVPTTRSLHHAAAAAGFRFIDAPVSGGIDGAIAGTLTFMVGGPEADAAQVLPLLEPMAGYTVHVGEIGAGQAAKIVNNMIFGVCLAATCEGVVLAQRLGVDPKVLYDITTRSSGDNWALRTWYPAPDVVPTAPSTRGFTPGFTTNLLIKDLTLAVSAGTTTSTPLKAAETALKLFTDNAAAGAGLQDCTALVLAIAERAEAGDPSLAAAVGR